MQDQPSRLSRRNHNAPGFVYFVETEDHQHVKIGFSVDVRLRFSALQTSNPHPIRCIGWMPGTRRDEAGLHARFYLYRGSGEWFKDSLELRAFIAELRLKPLDEFKAPTPRIVAHVPKRPLAVAVKKEMSYADFQTYLDVLEADFRSSPLVKPS